MSSRMKKIIISVVAIAAIAGGGAAIAGAASGDDAEHDTPISGAALDKASAAALDHVGEGKVTETEAGDEEGAYEVEVTRPDGSQVDVHFDKSFNVLNSAADHEDDQAEDHGDD